jgi:hypothetical protein
VVDYSTNTSTANTVARSPNPIINLMSSGMRMGRTYRRDAVAAAGGMYRPAAKTHQWALAGPARAPAVSNFIQIAMT